MNCPSCGKPMEPCPEERDRYLAEHPNLPPNYVVRGWQCPDHLMVSVTYVLSEGEEGR